MDGPDDVRSPRELHPIFRQLRLAQRVHGYWLLARLGRLYPDPQADQIQILLVEMLADDEKMRLSVRISNASLARI